LGPRVLDITFLDITFSSPDDDCVETRDATRQDVHPLCVNFLGALSSHAMCLSRAYTSKTLLFTELGERGPRLRKSQPSVSSP
jgi:hypothetical protein